MSLIASIPAIPCFLPKPCCCHSLPSNVRPLYILLSPSFLLINNTVSGPDTVGKLENFTGSMHLFTHEIVLIPLIRVPLDTKRSAAIYALPISCTKLCSLGRLDGNNGPSFRKFLFSIISSPFSSSSSWSLLPLLLLLFSVCYIRMCWPT